MGSPCAEGASKVGRVGIAAVGEFLESEQSVHTELLGLREALHALAQNSFKFEWRSGAASH